MTTNERNSERLFLSAMTMLAIAAFFRLLFARVTTYSLPLNMLWPLLPFLLATIIGGAIALHLHGLTWEQLIRVTVVLFTLVAAYTAIRLEGGHSVIGRVKQIPVYLVGASGGIFLLPLIDPAARKGLGIKTFRRIGISLAILLVLLISLDTTLSRVQGGAVGLMTLVVGAIIAGISIGLGLILSLVTSKERGIWAGSLGITLFISCYIVWVSFGAPWFP